MDSKHIQTILDTSPDYDDDRDNSLYNMIGNFYNRKMISIVIWVWGMGLLFMGGGITAAVLFFKATQTKSQILYAAVFLMCMQFLGMIKIFAWQVIHRNSIKRELKRLEIRLQDLSDQLS